MFNSDHQRFVDIRFASFFYKFPLTNQSINQPIYKSPNRKLTNQPVNKLSNYLKKLTASPITTHLRCQIHITFVLTFLLCNNLGAEKKIWTKQFGTVSIDMGYGVAIDNLGNVYVVGYTQGGLDGNSNIGGSDIFLTKYDFNGNKVWTKQFGTTYSDEGYGIAIDTNVNIYVLGGTNGSFDGNPTAGGYDIVLIKIDSSGNKIWTKQLGNSYDQNGFASVVDISGNIYLTGKTLGGLYGNSSAGSYDVFLTKYNLSGDIIWTKQFGTSGEDWGNGIAVDSSGNIYIVGWTEGGLDGNTNQGTRDIFLCKYDSLGNRIWTKQLGTAFPDFGRGIAIDELGNIYITGYTEGGLDGNANIGGSDIFLAKYDSNGNKVWIKQFGTNNTDGGVGVSLGNSSIFVSGYTFGDFDGNNAGNSDIFLTKYDFSGNRIWTNQIGSLGYDQNAKVSVNINHGIYITGDTTGNLDGNISAGSNDIFLMKFINSEIISGKVRKSDGTTAIPGAVVELWSSGVMISSTTTGTDGTYQLINVSTGTYWVFISSVGYIANLSTGVVVNAGQTSVLNLNLNLGDSSLVGYWKFDESSGTKAYDYSGYNNHGTIYGATWTPGTVGGALSFDGVDDYVKVPFSNSFNFAAIGSFTLEVGMTSINPNGYDALIVKGAGWWDYGIYFQSDRSFMAGSDSGHEVFSTTKSLNVRYFGVAVYDNGNWELYVNGVLENKKLNGSKILQSTGALCFGQKGEVNGDRFYGIIDEIRIYNRALTQVEIQADAGKNPATTVSTGTISGKVTKSDGTTAIVGAVVELWSSGVMSSSTTSAADGTYNLVNVATGTYDVQCRVTGYELRVTTGIVVSAGQTTTVNFALLLVDTDSPTVPGLISPADKSATTNTSQTFVWSPSTDTGSGISGYEVQVSKDVWFGVINYTGTPAVSQASLTTTSGIFYWRVRAKDTANNYSGWSPVWSFTVVGDTTPPAVPSLISPINNSTVTVTRPAFIWSAVPDDVSGGVTYAIQVANNIGFTLPKTDLTGFNTTSYTPTTWYTEGQYYWRVRATDGAGNQSSWSVPVTFTVKVMADTVSPSAVTDFQVGTSPATTNEGERVLLSWTATGDDGTAGNITAGWYRIDYATYSKLSWNYTSYVIEFSSNVTPGDKQVYAVANLMEGVTYWFCLWLADEMSNWSGNSNVVNIPVPRAHGSAVSPQITSLTPNAGNVGTVVTIIGQKFGSTQAGGSLVKFYNNITALITAWSETIIVCTVPPGTQTGNVVVITSSGTSNTVPFIVTCYLRGYIRDTNGVGISSVTVELQSSMENPQSVNTNSVGYYEFTGLPSDGNYVVKPNKFGNYSFNPEQYTYALLTTSLENQNFVVRDLVGILEGVINGRVTKSDGVTAIQGAVVELLSSGVMVSSTTTATDGTYQLINVSTGVYNVQCRVTGYELRVTTGVVVNAGQVTIVNFILAELRSAATYKITGYLKNRDGKGVSAVTVQLQSEVPSPKFVNVVTNAGGYYEFINLESGLYEVTVKKENWYFVLSTGTVPSAIINLSAGTEVNFTGTYLLVSPPVRIDVPIGRADKPVPIEMPRPTEAKVIVEESPDKPSDRRGTVNPNKGESVGIVFQPDKKPEEYVGYSFTIRIFNLTGELVDEFTKVPQTADDTWMKWLPKGIASGVYIIYVEGPGVRIQKKVAIVR